MSNGLIKNCLNGIRRNEWDRRIFKNVDKARKLNLKRSLKVRLNLIEKIAFLIAG
jgi:hypothetical protein